MNKEKEIKKYIKKDEENEVLNDFDQGKIKN